MMFSKRIDRTVLTFVVTMMSMFGISYCSYFENEIELPFTDETEELYIIRTQHLHQSKKICHEDFEELQSHYEGLIDEIKDFKIMDLVYPILPEFDDGEADVMDKILSAGNCIVGNQLAIIREQIYRIRHLREKHSQALSVDYVDSTTNQIVQELVFLTKSLALTTSQGRIQDIFMNTYYGNQIPMIPGKNCKHDLNGCSHVNPGNFVFDFDQQFELERNSTVDEQLLEEVQHDSHARGEGRSSIVDDHHQEEDRGHVIDIPGCGEGVGDHHEHTQECLDGVGDHHEHTQECLDGVGDHDEHTQECQDGKVKRYIRGFRHLFKHDHCKHCADYKELKYDMHIELQEKHKQTKSEFSSWLTDLKKTDPMFGEMYLSYAVKALRRRRMPLPQHLIRKYHGFKLFSKFHLVPELNATFIMSYLFHCPVGEKAHLHFRENTDDDDFNDSSYEHLHVAEQHDSRSRFDTSHPYHGGRETIPELL